MIILPDIHGRTFWKKVVRGHEDEQIIFLGDYNDPYPNEKITPDDSIENFKDIIKFKKDHPDNVILLIGNHDQHYFIPESVQSSRYSFAKARKLYSIFSENYDLFQICYETEVAGKTYVFSHAGITNAWVEDSLLKNVERDKLCDYLNNMYLTKNPILGPILSDISRYRGGRSLSGSVTWADVNEHYVERELASAVGDFQIFGHTQLKDPVMLGDHLACVDARRGIILDDDGLLTETDGDTLLSV